MRSGAVWLASAPLEVQEAFLAGLNEETLLALPYLFEFWALEHQVPPEGDWHSWVIMGGRGAGKTRAGAEWVRAQVEGARPCDPGRALRVALVGETLDQVREVMIFGESGIMACSPPDRRPEWQAARRRLVWRNGAVAQVFSAHEPESLRGPQFDAAWVDEYGCAAIDKGCNQPNKFLDSKSSESSLPAFSDGQRDDLIQKQYLRATNAFWDNPINNPIHSDSGIQMVDMGRAHAWAWDARPYPFFPSRLSVWCDGENYARGHWLNGRSSHVHLAAAVVEICAKSGVEDIVTADLHGIIRGHLITGEQTARGALQPLMLTYGFDAMERDGQLIFRSRSADAVVISGENLVDQGGDDPVTLRLRSASAEIAGRVRLSYVEADGDFGVFAEEAIFPDEATYNVSQSEMPLCLTNSEARAITERWLAESRIARDGLQFSLPQSKLYVGAGDVVELSSENGPTGRFRIDRIEKSDTQLIEAVRVEPSVYTPSDHAEIAARLTPFVPPVPVWPIFMDIPLLSDGAVDHAPYVAIAANPWPGAVAVYSSTSEDGYDLNTVVQGAATIGYTETALEFAQPFVRDDGEGLRVKLSSGALSSQSWANVLNGANVAAIGDGSSANWEIFQFETALLVAPDTYELIGRLRGQFGTDAVMPQSWPAGSVFVLLNSAIHQIDLESSARGLARHYRAGSAELGYDDPSYQYRVEVFDGNGLRPYSPAHLSTEENGGEWTFQWIRRSRIDADSWAGLDVPLGEASESYLLQIEENGELRREEILDQPSWTYTNPMQAEDGIGAGFTVKVAQISERYGPGIAAIISV